MSSKNVKCTSFSGIINISSFTPPPHLIATPPILWVFCQNTTPSFYSDPPPFYQNFYHPPPPFNSTIRHDRVCSYVIVGNEHVINEYLCISLVVPDIFDFTDDDDVDGDCDVKEDETVKCMFYHYLYLMYLNVIKF